MLYTMCTYVHLCIVVMYKNMQILDILWNNINFLSWNHTYIQIVHSLSMLLHAIVIILDIFIVILSNAVQVSMKCVQ